MESPWYHRDDYRKYDQFYDYIMSYRLDSSIPWPYGTVYEQKQLLKEEGIAWKIPASRKISSEKSGGVLAIVSNCKSGYRNKILKHFKENIFWPNGTSAFDFYGKCSGHRFQTDDFLKFRKKYRFYLAIENSRCLDYITEKFWQTIWTESVPIVAGQPRSNYERLIHKNAFIHLDDYKGDLKNLTDHINRLLTDNYGYDQYFEWRNEEPPYDYLYGTQDQFDQQGFCKLCTTAALNKTVQKEDLQNFWYHNPDGGKACIGNK